MLRLRLIGSRFDVVEHQRRHLGAARRGELGGDVVATPGIERRKHPRLVGVASGDERVAGQVMSRDKGIAFIRRASLEHLEQVFLALLTGLCRGKRAHAGQPAWWRWRI